MVLSLTMSLSLLCMQMWCGDWCCLINGETIKETAAAAAKCVAEVVTDPKCLVVLTLVV